MVELPSGTVTFLFTDIEGSTQLLKRLGARYGEILADHQRIVREATAERGGREIDTQGDSFFFAFARANAALGAAVVAQRALAEHAWPDGEQVRVRMGLHTGEPVVGEERYVGIGVHRAARIGAVGHGGQVLLSNATRELVDDEVDGVSIRELGSYRLKDIDRPERLFQLVIDGVKTEFPPLKADKVAEPRSVSRRTLLIGALVGVLAAAVAIPIFAFGQGGSGEDSIDAAAGNSVAIIDPETGRLVADVPVGTFPTDVVVGAGAVWATNTADGTVDRIDTGSKTVRQTIRVGSGPAGIAFGDGSIWVANGASGTVSRIDPESNEVIETIDVGNGPSGVAVGSNAVWVVNRDDHTLSRIDPASGEAARPSGVGIEPLDVAAGTEGVWVTSSDGKVLHIDPHSGSVVDTVNVGRRPTGISIGFGSIWVANNLDGTVSRIDPDSSAVTATIEVGGGPYGIAAGTDAIWVGTEVDATIARIDPASNNVIDTIGIGGGPAGLAVAPGGVYVAVRPGSEAHRGGTLTAVSPEPILGSLDPAVGLNTFASLGLTHDGLTGFKRVGGKEGTEVVANLADSLPQPTSAGRTYTFRLRKGIRYSTGKFVRARDFRRAIERHFALAPFDAVLYESIVGADACSRRPQQCDLSSGIVTDDRAGTVTFRLTEPDADLLAKLALPTVVAVPASTPAVDTGNRPLPATGPYMIASNVPGRQIRFVRNPRFRVWSRSARPDGYPDEIVIKVNVSPKAQLAAVARGEADVADLTLSGASEIARLRTRYGGRLHSNPGPAVVYTFLNERIPPFDDVRVRRALNYAVDRDAIVQDFGGADRASPSCQILPANYPGYEPYCPYGRDLAKARELVAASGSKGTPIVVWTRASYARFFSHVVDALRKLGYPTRLKVVEDTAYFDELDRAGVAGVQAGYVGWVAALPTAAEFMQSLLAFLEVATGQPTGGVLGREIEKALDLQPTDPLAANEAWAGVDRMLVDRAALVPLYNPRAVDFVSARIGNYQFNPFSRSLYDQFWVR
ncbi:MAG: ABC transporter substrate-binding protein [Actinomycetota bacterium]|nr:ABC transporter substrate-binding protein [Actinomycetota bacterium]